jgi:UDP-glucose 4-epimerase
MNLLVTGGAGYIGSVVTSELVRLGHRVSVLDNLSHGHRASVSTEARFILGDISDRTTLRSLFAESAFDGVLHFAAFIEAGESMKTPETFFRNNTANALTLLEAMLEFKVPRLVFSSTAALYGNPQRTPIEEDDLLKPTNAYGESKLLVEQMLAWFHGIHGFSYASLRYFNVAGATGELGEDHHPETHLIPLVLQVASGKRENIAIYGTDYETPDGTCIRDYIHVGDLAAAHILALESLAKSGEPQRLILNLGNGRGFSVREVIAAVRRITHHPIPAVELPRRPGDPAILVASSAKAKQELHWRPAHTNIEEIIRSAWEWRNRHPKGYGN